MAVQTAVIREVQGDTAARDVAVNLVGNQSPTAPVILPTGGTGTGFIAAANERNAQLEVTIQNQINTIQNNPLEVDTGALIGLIKTTFSNLSNRITESALASVKKSALEMDTYFGSPTGDQRSGARVKMATDVKRNLMQGAYQAIASVFDKQTQDIINVSLEAAKVNTAVAGMKAQNITALIGEMNNAYMAVLSETNKNYGMQLESALGWAQLQAETQYKYDALDFEYTKLDEQSKQFEKELSFEKWKTSEGFKIQKEQFTQQLEQDRYKFDTELDFNKWKTDETLKWEKDKFGQEIGFERQKYNDQKKMYEDQKKALEKSQTDKMLQQIANPSREKQYTQTDVLNAFAKRRGMTPATGGGGSTALRTVSAQLDAAGWPDQERVAFYMKALEVGSFKSVDYANEREANAKLPTEKRRLNI